MLLQLPRFAVLTTLTIGLLLLLAIPALAAGPGLDPTFNGTGIVINPAFEHAAAMVIQPADGKIVVAGSICQEKCSFALARYNSDGSPDTSFGISGVVTTSILGSLSNQALALQPDGRLVAAGYTIGPSSTGSSVDFAVVRYLTTGSLDETFGTGGIVTTSVSTWDMGGRTYDSYDQAWSVIVQPDGKIVVGGSSSTRPGSPLSFNPTLVRYTITGTLDTAFNNTGIVTAPINSVNPRHVAARQADGKLIIGGTGDNSQTFALARFHSNGSVDNTFGQNGIITTVVSGPSSLGYSVAVQPDNKVLIAGAIRDTIPDASCALLRYGEDGKLDTSFNGTGIVTAFLSAYCVSTALAVQNDEKILLAGLDGQPADFTLIRYTPQGQLDTAFYRTGIITTPVFDGDDGAYAVALQADGKIVAAGYGPDQGMVLVRYVNNAEYYLPLVIKE